MTTNRNRHQKSEFALFKTSWILFNFIQFVKRWRKIIFLGLNPKGPHLRLDKEKENFGVVFTNSIKTKSGRLKLGSFMLQSCNYGYKKA